MLSALPAFSQQYDILLAVIHNDSVTIIDSNARRNCLIDNTWDIYNDTYGQLNLFERNIAPGCAMCNCIFDFKVTIAGLASAFYTANIYQVYPDSNCGPDTSFIGILYFSFFNHQADTNKFVRQYQSDCHDIQGISESNKTDNFSISPNPFSTTTQITLSHTYHDISLSVYDMQGKLVVQNRYTDCDKIQLNRRTLTNGMYFLKLIMDDKEVTTGKIVVSE